MRSYRFPWQSVLFFLIFGLFSHSSARKADPIDTTDIHSAFINGDFDQATAPLESALKSKRTLSHAESLFTYKHLGVIYSAASSTREKGRYFLYQFVSANPNANILDMYVSDNIFLIFRNDQEDYKSKHSGLASSVAGSSTKNNTLGISPAVFWAAGGPALTVATGVFIYKINDTPKPINTLILVKE